MILLVSVLSCLGGALILFLIRARDSAASIDSPSMIQGNVITLTDDNKQDFQRVIKLCRLSRVCIRP